MKKAKIIYQKSEIEQVFQKLISDWNDLTDFYNDKVIADYEDPHERLPYIDIGDISSFIVDKKKSEQTENFETFFKNVEEIIILGDDYVKNLIVIGLFEGIQNKGGTEINYYKSFDKWLKENSLRAWRELIDVWEGTGWKKTNLSQKILNKKIP